MVGGDANTLAFVHDFRPEKGTIAAHLVPLAVTPMGVVLGEGNKHVGIAPGDLLEWVERTFPADVDQAFITSLPAMDLLARIGWHAPAPDRLTSGAVLNVDELPDELIEALDRPPALLVACAACRRLCVSNEFVWRDRRLCAWDYHAQVFGPRGPWRNGPYEERHFETLPACAYVASPLLAELDVAAVLATSDLDETVARQTVNLVLAADPDRSYLAVRTEGGYTLLRELVAGDAPVSQG
ncbi:MAG: hypothetical protein ACYDA5_09885 [Vulcanimicrobiaceae bacterium]